jgi:type VI protein secretion system component Hcp
MKFRFPWIACFLIAALAQAHASTTAIVTFEPANRCAPASDGWLALAACPANTAFDALSYSWDASLNSSAVSLSSLQIMKVVDGTSAPFLMKMLAGQSIPHVRISVYSTDVGVPANTINPLYELYLSDVYVSGFSTSDASGGGPPVQVISLSYGSISVRVVTLNPDGTIASTTIIGYDQSTASIF